MQELAKEKGGKCLSSEYINTQTKLKWQCSDGHIWFAKPRSIRNNGSWCPECKGTKKLTLEEMKLIAKIRGGKCLSHKYIDGKTKLKWQCSFGHNWEAKPTNVKNKNSWCPKCKRLKRQK